MSNSTTKLRQEKTPTSLMPQTTMRTKGTAMVEQKILSKTTLQEQVKGQKEDRVK